MAVARLVCGDCGEPLAPSDARCPSCGASIERESSSAAPAPSPSAPVNCGVCGEKNSGASEFCTSCGARLGGKPAARQGKARRTPQQQQQAARRPASPARSGRLWQIISVVAIVALLSYIIYLQISGERHPGSSAADSGSPQEEGGGGAPFAGAAAKSIDLTPLEDAVRDHPADPAVHLKLANALNDSRLFARAIEAYRKYLSMRPKDSDARTDMGICYFQEAQADSLNRASLLHEAASVMQEAFRNAPRPHQPSAFNLGIVYLHLSDMDSSSLWFRKAVEINPESDLGKRAQSMVSQHTIPQ
jgi:tetratricopeptide (TPR) repeat protein